MRGLGILLIVFGIGSAILPFIDMQFRLMEWIDTWGEGPAWGIRAGAIVVGVIVLMAGSKKTKYVKAT